MKPARTFTAIIFLFLIAGFFLASCGGDDGNEQARIEYVKTLDAEFSLITVWPHGPRNTHVTFSASDVLTEKDIKIQIGTLLTAPRYTKMIKLGFTKLYFCSGNIKVEFYANKKENCWEIK